jgi:hypothetical protein
MMKVIGIIFFTFFYLFIDIVVATTSYPQSSQDQEIEDSRIPPMPVEPPEPNTPPKLPFKPPPLPPKLEICETVPTEYCFIIPDSYEGNQILLRRYVLSCYCPGNFINNKENEFMNLISKDVRELLSRGYTFSGIFKITGYADGLINRDYSLPDKICIYCKENKPVKNNDEALAHIRSCIFEKKIRKEFVEIGVTDIILENVDVPDGGVSGNKMRKVEIEIGFINKDGY